MAMCDACQIEANLGRHRNCQCDIPGCDCNKKKPKK